MARAGRRPGSTTTREEILRAARTLFAARGYDATSIRAIAAAAEVNPALVHHFFGTKDEVFIAALDVPINPGETIANVLDGPRSEVGERLVRTFLGTWGDPLRRASLVAILRSVTTNESRRRRCSGSS